MKAKHKTALLTLIPLLVMTALGASAVPLYRAFCQATGYNGTTNRAQSAPGAIADKVTVAFDTNVSPQLDWKFEPEQRQENVQVGARTMAFFLATNNSDHPVTGRATFNVTPPEVGKYFTKIQCFCFTQQTLKPGESARMPVIFFVDPRIAQDDDTKDVRTITLSYTFYPVDSAKKAG